MAGIHPPLVQPTPKLLDRVRGAIRTRHYSRDTEDGAQCGFRPTGSPPRARLAHPKPPGPVLPLCCRPAGISPPRRDRTGNRKSLGWQAAKSTGPQGPGIHATLQPGRS